MRNNVYEDNPFVVARKAAGLLQREAAEALHVERATVAAWETGRTMPRVAKLHEIARLYHCPVTSLIGEPEQAAQ